jgi:hypothetical protein
MTASKRDTAMPAWVKIKEDKYGTAIRLLLHRGGSFQTRPDDVLIVNSEQMKVLEEADLIETNGAKPASRKKHGHKKDVG